MALRLTRSDEKVLGVFLTDAKEAYEALKLAVLAYKAAAANLSEEIDIKRGDWRDAYNDRTDRWKKSETGGIASRFVESWEKIDLDSLEVEIDGPGDTLAEIEELLNEGR